MKRPWLILVLLFVGAFSLATWLEPRHAARDGGRSDSALVLLMGDGRKLFANEFFAKADAYFHGGDYPSIFEINARRAENHMIDEAGHGEAEHAAHAEQGEHEEHDAGEPARDWIEALHRRVHPSTHTHLEGGEEREMLPWLRVAAELNPQQVEAYTVAAYWLRVRLNKVDEAEQFLREGLRANPNNYEILLELGRLYYESRQDVARARNVWHLALRRWRETEQAKEEPDYVGFNAIVISLGHLEEVEGNYAEAITWFELARPHSPNAEALGRKIELLRVKLAPGAPEM